MREKMKNSLMTMLVFCLVGTQAAELKLVNNGQPTVRIRTMSADAAVVHAADEFVSYMKAILKRSDYTALHGSVTLQLAIAGDESCHQADELMRKHNLDRKKLGDEGFLVAESGKRNYMLCAYTGKGVLNGVYKLFEKSFGAVAPRPLVGLEFPTGLAAGTKNIVLPYSDKPHFPIRGLLLTGKQAHPQINQWNWMARVGMNGRGFSVPTYLQTGWAKDPYGFIDLLSGHSFLFWVPAREYFKDHPEYYSLINGKRSAAQNGSQLSLGNPEVIDLLVRRMLKYMEKHPELTTLPFGYNDSGSDKKNQFGWSEDPRDLAMDSPNDFPKPGSSRSRTWSTRYIKAANEIISRVNKVYPNVKLMVYAYHFSMLKPPDCPIHPNIIIQIAPLYMCAHHPINDPNCPRNRYFEECLRGWTAKSRNVYAREYYSGYNRHFPLATLSAMKANLLFYKKLSLAGFAPETRPDGPNAANITGYYGEGSTPDSERMFEDYWDSSGLLHFTLARLGWNPDESIEDIVNLYCRSYYGPKVGPLMAKYFLLMDSNLVKSSHPGEKAPNDDPADDRYAKIGPWCTTWNWKMPLTGFAKKLFMTSIAEEVERTAMPLMLAMSEARTESKKSEWIVRCRIDKDYELLKRYLLCFGYEIFDFRQRQNSKATPQFSVKGRGSSVEVD